MNKLLLAVVIGAAFMGSAQATEYIVNGTFADPSDNTQTGWTVNSSYYQYGVNSYMEGAASTPGVLTQKVLNAYGKLTLSFDFTSTADTVYQTNTYAGVQDTYFNNILISHIFGVTPLTHYTFLLTGTGNDTLSFAGTNVDWYNQLSNVSLVSAPVPEPESYAMLLAGMGLIAAAVKRRKAIQA